tara:strand:+ start:249 stop:554 length:306 start_codon:yes stop_codon:yes gene_type:complete
MSLYEADGKKQKPIVRDGIVFYSHATCPAVDTKVKRPTYVVINAPGSYKFSYENTPTTYITGSILVDDNGPIRLDIQPTAWSQADAAGTVGDVTFVYVRVS